MSVNASSLRCVRMEYENLSVCWQHVSADLLCQSPLLGGQVTFTDCCCMYGEGWGMGCALCPTQTQSFSFCERKLCRHSLLVPLCSVYYSEGDYSSPDSSAPQTPSFRLPPDPRSEIGFGARPFPPSRPDGPPLSLAPLPGSPYDDQEEEDEMTWRPRRYESYAGLSAAEDCGILHGCENGRCIRVAEGYTCDCYHGYELDMTSMTCIDINECEDGVGLEFPCVNARCVNTEGSFRCVCRRGYVVSRRRNHCVAA
uniref:Latent transforming growth factor beta binding protein 4 n=1 Tax=Oryzias latipes TaxID=8090 RepID=A0A3P9HRA8_ORYLA